MEHMTSEKNKDSHLNNNSEEQSSNFQAREELQEKRSVMQENFSSSVIVVIAKLTIAVMTKCWRACTAGLLILLLCFWLYGSLMALCLVLLGVLGILYNAQDMLLYHPDQPQNSRLYVESPAILHLPFDNTFINTPDGERLHLILIKQPPERIRNSYTIVFFHGNAGNIGHRLLNAYGLYNSCKANILLVEYRGYGKSSGSPSEKGIYIDAEAAIEYALKHPEIDPQRLILFGRSLGGAVAIHAAVQPQFKERIAGLMLENTFLSLPEIGRSIFNFRPITLLPEWCHKNKFMSKKHIRQVRCPVLFLSGLADSLVPPRMMRDLYEQCPSLVKYFKPFDGGTHNETWQSEDYFPAVSKFLSEVARTQHSAYAVPPEDYHRKPFSNAAATFDV